MTPCRLAALPLTVTLLAVVGPRTAAAPSTAPAASPRNRAPPSLALMRAVTDAWETRDPSRAAPFYAPEAGLIFFDVAPLDYRGWDAYAAGAAAALQAMQTLRITLDPGAVVRVADRSAWGAATMRYEIALRDGGRVSRDARWTVVWEKRGGSWLIVHEHVSFPDAPP